MKYQYHVWNDVVSFLVTIPIKEDEYAKSFGRNVATDFYSIDEKYLRQLYVDYICEFHTESFINLNMLNN